MKSPIFSVRLLLLLLLAGLVAACGTQMLRQNSKQQAQKQTQGEQQKPKQTAVSNDPSTWPIDSFVLSKQVWVDGMTVSFDKSKCNDMPSLSPEDFFRRADCRALLGFDENYDIVYDNGLGYYRLRYKGLLFDQKTSIGFNSNGACIYSISCIKLTPRNSPSEVRISEDEAREIALKQEYITRDEQKWRVLMKDSTGKYPPYKSAEQEYAKRDNAYSYPPEAQFAWEKRYPTKEDSINFYPQGELCYMQYGERGDEAVLAYVFHIPHIYSGDWKIYIDAMTGAVFGKGRMDFHFAPHFVEKSENKKLFTCLAGTNPPTLTTSSLNTLCPTPIVKLNNYVSNPIPVGTKLVWFNNNTNTPPLYNDPSSDKEGTFYAYYFDTINICFSPPSAPLVVSLSVPQLNTSAWASNICPTRTFDLNSTLLSTAPNGTVLEWYSKPNQVGLLPLSPNVGTGTYYAFYKNTATFG